MGKRVLVVEDDVRLTANLFSYLETREYCLEAARDGQCGLELALALDYDAIVLDWRLPQIDGLQLLQGLRAQACATPVLMLTARNGLADKIAAFKAGADDYLTKPFALAELEVRLDALICRSQGRSRVLQVADLRFDLATQEVTRGRAGLQLYCASKRLLEALMKASPNIVGRERLEQVLWGDDPPDRDMLRSHVYELRKAVDGSFPQKLIRTIPKQGYCIRAAPTPA